MREGGRFGAAQAAAATGRRKGEDADRQRYALETLRSELAGPPGGAGLNISYAAVDRHAAGARAEHTALRWLANDGDRRDISYRQLRAASNRFANVLQQLGVAARDRVFVMTGRIPELYYAALGTWKHRSVFCPLFAAFGPEPVFQRLARGDARLLVTTEQHYRRKIEPQWQHLPLEYVLLTDADEHQSMGLLSLPRLMEEASTDFRIPATAPDDMATLHFTSGTTGMPKGAIHVHEGLLWHYASAQAALDLQAGDIYWCTADPGWVTGTSYGIIAPLLHGLTSIVAEAEFDIEGWYGTLAEQGVTVWYTAPTAIRMLMRQDFEPRQRYNLDRLRMIASVGEPLNPEALAWARRTLKLPIHDNWWQTETGGIMIANVPGLPIRPGSMGRPLPGIEAAIVRRDNDGTVGVMTEADAEGELALRKGWPSMMRGYLHEEERYRECFAGDWYLSGDLARRDADGYYWFVGRADDMIKTAGHLVGPFEVESALMEHPAIAEAAVIGKPDPIIASIVKAFVMLKPGRTASEELRRDLLGFARRRLGSAVAPKEIAIVPDLPRTRSGKIMRRLLRARELGLPEGDTSTLETGA